MEDIKKICFEKYVQSICAMQIDDHEEQNKNINKSHCIHDYIQNNHNFFFKYIFLFLLSNTMLETNI
jgi:hypothetical protein